MLDQSTAFFKGIQQISTPNNVKFNVVHPIKYYWAFEKQENRIRAWRKISP